MIFLEYASQIAAQIVRMVDVRYTVQENTIYCKKQDIFGYVDPNTGVYGICTNRIILVSRNHGVNPKYYMNETLYHEAAHAAQFCRAPHAYVLGIPWASMPLSAERARGVMQSVALSGANRSQRELQQRMEHEAFWLEDKPEATKNYVQRFCF